MRALDPEVVDAVWAAVEPLQGTAPPAALPQAPLHHRRTISPGPVGRVQPDHGTAPGGRGPYRGRPPRRRPHRWLVQPLYPCYRVRPGQPLPVAGRPPEGHGTDAVLAALNEILDRIPAPLRRTLTWDQGREMARHAELAEMTGITVYFADPHSPWQRPTNENGNGLIRRYVGKGTNLSIYTPADLRAIETRINTIPRRSIHWATAQDLYHAAVAMTG